MYNKTIVVGDLHGKLEIATHIVNKYGHDHNIVFVGDYLDSYDRSSEDCVKTLTFVLDAIERSPTTIIGLLGNHEYSYLRSDMRCSGWMHNTEICVNHLKTRMLSTLKHYHWITPSCLVTHAGLSGKLPINPLFDIDDVLEDETVIYNIGRIRGGLNPIGGIFWCHYPDEFLALPSIIQVFGHTRGKGIRTKDNMNYCIDCLEDDNPQVLLIDKEQTVSYIDL